MKRVQEIAEHMLTLREYKQSQRRQGQVIMLRLEIL